MIYWEILLSQSNIFEMCVFKWWQDLTIFTYREYNALMGIHFCQKKKKRKMVLKPGIFSMICPTFPFWSWTNICDLYGTAS